MMLKIIKIVNESADVKSFIFKLPENGKVEFLPGNFVKISLQGVGESTFAISRIFPGEKCFAVSVKRTGYHTKMLHRTGLEQIVGFRGPYGNSFPVSEWHGNNIVIIGGGIGFAPLRPLIDYILNNRNQYGKLTIEIMGMDRENNSGTEVKVNNSEIG